MPPRDWTLRVTDILSAIEAIADYTSGLDFPSFSGDRRTVDAVVRNLTVIGEAASRIPTGVVSKHPEVPWRDMADVRNVVVHEYFGVDERVIWDTIKKDLPPLVAPLSKLLRDSESR